MNDRSETELKRQKKEESELKGSIHILEALLGEWNGTNIDDAQELQHQLRMEREISLEALTESRSEIEKSEEEMETQQSGGGLEQEVGGTETKENVHSMVDGEGTTTSWWSVFGVVVIGVLCAVLSHVAGTMLFERNTTLSVTGTKRRKKQDRINRDRLNRRLSG